MDVTKSAGSTVPGCVYLGMLLSCCAGPAPAMEIKSLLPKFGGPKIEIALEHPPALPFKVNTVAVGPPQGECSQSLATRLEEAIVQAGTTLIDRQRLNELMKEHKLQTSNAFNEKTAAKIGQLIGAQALIFLQVQQCKATQERREMGYTEEILATSPDMMLKGKQEKKEKDKKPTEDQPAYMFITNGSIAGSMRVVDLTSGRVLAAQRFEAGSSLSSAQNFMPDEAATSAAEKSAAADLIKMILPWKEPKQLVFYEDELCDLKIASRMLRTNDVEGALKQSEANLESCKSKPKVKPRALARAHYNLGMVQFIKGEYELALENLTSADRMDDSAVFLNAITEARRANDAKVERIQYESDQQAAKPKLSVTKPKLEATPKPREQQDAASIEQRLSRLSELLKKNLITKEEYEVRRTKILNET